MPAEEIDRWIAVRPKLFAAILARAILDAQAGNPDAVDFLSTSRCHPLLRFLFPEGRFIPLQRADWDDLMSLLAAIWPGVTTLT